MPYCVQAMFQGWNEKRWHPESKGWDVMNAHHDLTPTQYINQKTRRPMEQWDKLEQERKKFRESKRLNKGHAAQVSRPTS
jgi:hypothetical protein